MDPEVDPPDLLMRDLFGSSSSSSSPSTSPADEFLLGKELHESRVVNGLSLIRGFLNKKQQAGVDLYPSQAPPIPILATCIHTYMHEVDTSIDEMMPTPSSCQEWFRSQAQSLLPTEEANQAMRFGDLPEWAIELSDMIAKAAGTLGALPDEVGGMQGDATNGPSQRSIYVLAGALLWLRSLKI